MKVKKENAVVNEGLNETFITNIKKVKDTLVWLMHRIPSNELADEFVQMPSDQLGIMISNLINRYKLSGEAENKGLGKDTKDKAEMKALNPRLSRVIAGESLKEDFNQHIYGYVSEFVDDLESNGYSLKDILSTMKYFIGMMKEDQDRHANESLDDKFDDRLVLSADDKMIDIDDNWDRWEVEPSRDDWDSDEDYYTDTFESLKESKTFVPLQVTTMDYKPPVQNNNINDIMNEQVNIEDVDDEF